MPNDPHLPARLLSGRPEMSAPEKEAVLGAVLARVADRPGSRPSPMRWALVATSAAAMLVLVAGTLTLGWFGDRPATDGLTARGGPGPGPFGLQVGCPGPGACRPGSKLIFQLDPPADRPWFTAFGRRPDGVVVWYFPATADAHSTDARLGDGHGVLPTGVRLAGDHPPGQVQVRAQFCVRPVGRAQIQAVYEGTTDPERIGCTLVEHSFAVTR